RPRCLSLKYSSTYKASSRSSPVSSPPRFSPYENWLSFTGSKVPCKPRCACKTARTRKARSK
ncbi:MAG: hypothetical protein QXQ17_07225, partial [Desulfurococcaceae archaeon]